MVSVLRTLQAEFNALVPQAQSRGIRVRPVNMATLEPIARRRARLDWLRAQLGSTTTLDALTFGVELELIMPRGVTRESLAAAIAAAGVDCRSLVYTHGATSQWKIVTDGSLGSYTTGAEVVSPILSGEAGFAQLRTVCQVLVAQGCKVNRKCGFHVHVGARSESVEFFRNLVTMYASAETAIDSFMAPSRRQSANIFCRPVRWNSNTVLAQTINGVVQSIGQAPGRGPGRYCKLNLQSYYQHGTVEFRHHQGTVESDKVENWVRLVLRMCLTARQREVRATTVNELLTAVECSGSERDYFTRRVARFERQALRRAA